MQVVLWDIFSPIVLTWLAVSNTAEQGKVPDTVIYSFYGGAAILIFCVIYTTLTVKEYPPQLYNEYHQITPNAATNASNQTESKQKAESSNVFALLVKAPSTFWTVGLVQFFCWAAFMFYVDLHQWFDSKQHFPYTNNVERRSGCVEHHEQCLQ